MGQKTYGLVRGNANIGSYFPVAADQYFHHGYGGFVELNSSGHITIADSASEVLLGWAMFPESGTGAAASTVDYWLSSATAGADKLFVITDLNAWFSMPIWTGGAIDEMTQAQVGGAVNISYTNGSTAGQFADLNDTGSDDIILIRDWNSEDTSIVIVQMNPKEIQVST